MAGPNYTVIPNDWQNLEYIIADLSHRIINEDTSFSDYILADGSRVYTSDGAGFKDEDTMNSDSAVATASQQSVKAYVDNSFSAAIGTVEDTGVCYVDSDEKIVTDVTNLSWNYSTNTLTTVNLTVSGLTATRIPYAGTGGLLSDSANLTWNNTSQLLKAVGGLWLDGTTGDTPTSGAGTRLMWIPSKPALRVGEVTGTKWDAANIGAYSVAFGYDAEATGNVSIALGRASSDGSGGVLKASGEGAIAMGDAEEDGTILASGDGSIAMGSAATGGASVLSATNYGSIAMGAAESTLTSTGIGSIAIGNAEANNITSSGAGSFAGGTGDNGVITSSGTASFAFGWASQDDHTATGTAAIAMGDSVRSTANYAMSFGYDFANSTASSFAIGFGAIDLLITTGSANFQDTIITTTSNIASGIGFNITANSAWATLSPLAPIIGKMSAHGLVFVGTTGSTNDFAIVSTTGTTLMRNPTGTNQFVFGASPNVEIGVGLSSTPAATVDVARIGQCSNQLTTYSTNLALQSSLLMRRSYQNTEGLTATPDNTVLGRIAFYGVDTAPSWSRPDAYIQGIQNGSAGASDVPVDLEFYTSPGGTTAAALRMTIDKNGVALFHGKVAFTQTDLNEYIDSDADGYLDIYATNSIRLHDPLMILESSAAVADVATYGQFWVKDDTPNIPKFTDDAGNDYTLAYEQVQSGCIVHRNAVDQTGAAATVAFKIEFTTEDYDFGSEFDHSLVTGTADATEANKLHDDDAGFTSDLVGATVWNTTDDTYAEVTAFVDSGELTLDTDIMVNGETYRVYHSKFTPTTAGYYLVNLNITYTDIANANYAEARIQKNGSDVAVNTILVGATGYNTVDVSRIIYCDGSTDYIEGFGRTQASNRTVLGTAYATYMDIIKLNS